MNLIQSALKNKQFILTLYFFFAILGIYSIFTIPRYENPPITAPGVSIFIGYPGASPQDVEKLILDPLEDAIHEISKIKRLQSICKDDLVELRIEFHHDVDINEKYREIIDKFNNIEKDLPEDIAYRLFVKWSVSDINIFQLAIVPDSLSYFELDRISEDLKNDLEQISGIKKVSIYGLPEKKIYVDVDPALLSQYHLSALQLLSILQSSNYSLPGGSIQMGARKVQVQLNTDLNNVYQLQNLVLKSDGKHVLLLKDVAHIYSKYENKDYIVRFDKKPAIFIAVSQEEKKNIYPIISKVKKVIQQYESRYPTIHFYPAFDQSRSVSYRLNNFLINFLEGLFLVGVIVFLLIHYRASLIILLALPLSLLIALFLLDTQGFGLQQVSIAGMIIALGMLVDNSIVVTENIERMIANGIPRDEAVIKAPSQVAWAVFSATSTTVLAFTPMLFLKSSVGDFVRTLPLVVIYSLVASYLISITLTPILSQMFLSTAHQEKRSFLQRGLQVFLQRYYKPLLEHVLLSPHKYIGIAFIIFVFSLGLFPFIGISFFPKAEIPQIMVQVKLPKGSSIHETDKITAIVEDSLLTIDGVLHISTNIGHGNPRIYYNHLIPLQDPSMAEILCEIKTFNPVEIAKIVEKIRRKISSIPGAEMKVIEFTQGPPQEAPIEIRVTGKNLDKLMRISRKMETIISTHPAVVNIENPLKHQKLNLKIEIFRDKASLYGVTMQAIAQTVRTALEGTKMTSIHASSGEKFDIIVRLASSDSIKLSDLYGLYVPSISGALVPLKEIGRFYFESQPVEIRHYNFLRVGMVKADVKRGYSAVKVTAELKKKLDQALPHQKEYKISFGGEKENQQEAFRGMYRALMVAIFLVILILVIQFKSYFQPFIIISAVPMATIGSFVFLFITRNSFSFMAFIGFISLVGIVVNNAIVLVDYTNQLLQEEQKLDEAIREAATTRFRPIISTTLTTILGLLPLTLFGGTLWAPLGWVIIGGLLSSTFLTLLIVPALYKIFYKVEKFVQTGLKT